MTPSALVRARRATHLAFFVFGAVMATFGVQVPSIRAQYRLDDAELSIALFGVAVGAVLCLVFAGRLIAAHGHRRTCAVSALAMCAALALLLRFEHPALLGLLVVVFGACVGLFDVAINAEGSAIETAMGRKVMSQMHGLWSLGGMAGALAASAMTRVGWAPAMQTGLVALAALAGAGLACVGLLPRRAHASPAAASADGPAPASGWRQMARPTRRHVALLGAPFHRVYTAQQAQAYKPRLQAFEYMLDSLGCNPEDMLHVSSSLRYDLMSADDIGIVNKVFINRGHGPGCADYRYVQIEGIDGLPGVVGL